MGGDNAPLEIVKGAVEAADKLGVDVILTGKGDAILDAFQTLGMSDLPKGIEIAHASQVITMEDDPATAVRQKRDSSMTVALNMLRDDMGDAVVSAGSTGALLSGATLVVKRIKGIRRAAVAPYIPNGANGMIVIDAGANVECTPEYLMQFAYMGSFYAKSILNLDNPRVGLLNIGTEDTKGTDLQKSTYALLAAASESGRINFVGNVEAREAIMGDCDVLVADGFSGNVFLKAVEGTAMFLTGELKGMFKKNALTKLGALLCKSGIADFKKKMDYTEYGGTAMLGITKPVIKAHGSSDAKAIFSAIRQARDTVNANVTEGIKSNIEYMKLDDKVKPE
jgi:glycerol-3-phosphate acyltransferase PlsX